jgi:RNA polymerase sigma-70 factor (ECF subfamily)
MAPLLFVESELPGRDPRDAPERTLGDVLYPDKPRAVVLEADWVELVRFIAGGDQRAFQVLYQQTYRIVFTLIMRIVGNRETAEEVTLDVFHEVWRRASTYDPAGGSVVGWIMNQARSRAIDRLRYDTRKKRVENGAEPAPGVTGENDPQVTFDAREQGHRLRLAVEALTPRERQALETAFLSGLTYAETAVRLNQPVGTVKTRIRSALAKLRQALAGTVAHP